MIPPNRPTWLPHRSSLVLILALALATIGLLGRASQAADPKPVEVENIRVGFEERYKVGSWTPVWVQLRGGLNGFSGIMEVVAPDEDGTSTRMSQPVQVGPGATLRVTAYTRIGSRDHDFATLRFFNGQNGRRAINDINIGELMANRSPEPLPFDGYQVVRLGKPQGVELIPGLPGYNATKAANANLADRAKEVAVASLTATDDLLPGRWYGYDSADVVALDTSDKEIIGTLNGGKGEALRQWVERGGHLVISVSSNWQVVNESMLAPMLPARLTGQTTVAPFDSLESFTGGSQQVTFENSSIPVARFDEIETRGGKVIASTLSTPLVIRGAYGFGRVTVIGLDTDAPPFSNWPDRTLFWVKALDLRGTNASVEGGQVAGRLINYNNSDLATVVRRALDQFQGVTPVPFAWVAGFILIYILLVGPGDYFFVKKVLRRMELTWVTFPLIVIVVSLLAYYAAYYVKGTDLRVNKLDVVDLDLDAKVIRGTTWVNLFSPQNRDYSVALSPIPPTVEIPTNPETVVKPLPGTEVLLSWFGAPENGLRGMNGQSRGMGFGNSGYAYAPLGKAESLEDVRVGIWSTKGFVGRWFGPSPSPETILDVDIQAAGTDRLTGTITNKLPYPLKNAMVVYGKQVYYNVGTIEAGATIEIDKFLDRSLASYLREKQASFMSANMYMAQPEVIARADLLRQMMFHSIDTSGQEITPSRIHHELDLSGLLPLGRPMLVAEVDRPGVQLILGNKSSQPKVELTSILRVIMPLKRDPATKAK